MNYISSTDRKVFFVVKDSENKLCVHVRVRIYTFQIPNIVLSALDILTYLIPITTIKGWLYHYFL